MLPADGVVAVTAEGGLQERLDDLPLGSVCLVSEQGAAGSYGEASRRGDGQTVEIRTPNADGDEIPTAQIASITNVYVVPPVDPPVDLPTGDGGLPGTGGDGAQAAALAALATLLLLLGAAFVTTRRRREADAPTA